VRTHQIQERQNTRPYGVNRPRPEGSPNIVGLAELLDRASRQAPQVSLHFDRVKVVQVLGLDVAERPLELALDVLGVTRIAPAVTDIGQVLVEVNVDGLFAVFHKLVVCGVNDARLAEHLVGLQFLSDLLGASLVGAAAGQLPPIALVVVPLDDPRPFARTLEHRCHRRLLRNRTSVLAASSE